MTDVSIASTSMSKLKKPTPIKSSGIPKLVTTSASPPVSLTPTKPSRFPVSRPLSRSISSSSSPAHHSHNDATNPPNTPVTPASARTPIKRVTQSMGRPSTPDTTRLATTSRIPSKLPPTPTSTAASTKPAFKISSKAAEITSRLSTPSHSRAQSVSVDHLDPSVTRTTPSRVPTNKLIRPSTAGSSRIGMGRPASQSIASSTTSSVAGTAHSSPKQTEKRTINQKAKQSPPDILDLDAILASAQAAQQAAQEVNEQERELAAQQPLSPHLQTLHQRRKSERSLVVDSNGQFEPNSPGLLDLDDFGAFDDSEFDTPARPVQHIQPAVVQPVFQQPMFDDADGLTDDVHRSDNQSASHHTNEPAQDETGMFDDEDIHFDDSNDNNLVEAPVKPMQESKEAEDQDHTNYFNPSFTPQQLVTQSNRTIVNSRSSDFDEKEQSEPEKPSNKYSLEVMQPMPVEPVREQVVEADDESDIQFDAEPVVEQPVVHESVTQSEEPVMYESVTPAEQPVVHESVTKAEQQVDATHPEHDLLDDDLSAFDNDEPLEFDDDFFEASPRANNQQVVLDEVIPSQPASQAVVQSFIIVEPSAVDSEHLPSATPPTRTPNVTIVEQSSTLHVEQSSEPWALMGRTDDINEVCFEDENQHFDEEAAQSKKMADKTHLMIEKDNVVTRTPAPSNADASHLFSSTRTPAPSAAEPRANIQTVIAVETVTQSVMTSSADFDDLQDRSTHRFDSVVETRAPASTAWSQPQPVVVKPKEQAVADFVPELESQEAEAVDDGLDLSFGDNMSLPVSPVHAAASAQPQVQTFNQSVSSVHDYAISEADANKAAAAKLREVEETRRADLDRQLAGQAAVAARSLKERQELERAEEERFAAEEAEYQRQEAEREQLEYDRENAMQHDAEHDDHDILSDATEVTIDATLLDKWSEGVNVTKLGRNGKTRATSIFLNESNTQTIGLAWVSKSKKPADARMILGDCRCVIGAEDGLFVHRKYASKFDSNSGMCVSLIAPTRSLDIIFNSEEDLDSFVVLMKTLNVRVHNRVPAAASP